MEAGKQRLFNFTNLGFSLATLLHQLATRLEQQVQSPADQEEIEVMVSELHDLRENFAQLRNELLEEDHTPREDKGK